ncbi:hypothetical protein [Aquincola tertiaricarbonis]|uniref:hypothetical protein n=1 Tax=Aquincola tertiaricarbonis TaxID=391953 RepID=UPI0009F9BC9A|nr:hypothetical protein [Aquincola tertiaricarbonis]
MNTTAVVTAVASLLLAATAATAQFVKGNEAVKILPDGSRRVETPPQPADTLMPQPCPAARPGCSGGGWRMVETQNGIEECTELYARPTTCRSSTFGLEKRSRLWIVKSGGIWLQCQHPNLQSRCVSTKALPYSAVQ